VFSFVLQKAGHQARLCCFPARPDVSARFGRVSLNPGSFDVFVSGFFRRPMRRFARNGCMRLT
jgi:hypothetical protein